MYVSFHFILILFHSLFNKQSAHWVKGVAERVSGLEDCLVVQAPNNPPSEPSILIEPVDTLTLATYIKHAGFSVVFHDLDRFGLNPLRFEPRSFRIAVAVLDYQIPLHTSRSVELLDEVFKLLKEKAQVCLMVGRLSSYNPRSFLVRFPLLDGCIIGEAEETLVKILESRIPLAHQEGVITMKTLNMSTPVMYRPHSNIYSKIPESGPIADRSLCQFHSYIDVHSIISSRGCSGSCLFCSNVHFWGKWRGASPTLVLNEFKHVVESGARKVIFLDDNFTDDRERALQIARSLKKARFDVPWGCLSRIEDISPSLATEMANAGCRWIHFGIEHGTEEVRRSIGKFFTNEQAIKTIEMVKSLGIRVRTSWILDLPTATMESIETTFRFIQRLASHEVKLHFLAIRPGSTYYQNATRENQRELGEISIHMGKPNRPLPSRLHSLPDALERFRNQMERDGYEWVDDVRYWRRYMNHEASPDDRFVSTVIMRYGLGW
jgi:radical SAM superfamily enzyme YgiQ (UPF0313 family)